jgi:hypothetical protein
MQTQGWFISFKKDYQAQATLMHNIIWPLQSFDYCPTLKLN